MQIKFVESTGPILAKGDDCYRTACEQLMRNKSGLYKKSSQVWVTHVKQTLYWLTGQKSRYGTPSSYFGFKIMWVKAVATLMF